MGSVKVTTPALTVYKCYYDANGKVTAYSINELEGQYIEISAAEYIAAKQPARVVAGKLIIEELKPAVEKLVPSDTGTMCHKKDVCVVVKKDGVYWRKQSNEIN